MRYFHVARYITVSFTRQSIFLFLIPSEFKVAPELSFAIIMWRDAQGMGNLQSVQVKICFLCISMLSGTF